MRRRVVGTMRPDILECEDVDMKRESCAIALLVLAAGCGGGGGGGGHTTGGSGTIPIAPILPTYATSAVPASAGIEDIAAAPDGSMWFSEFAAGKIGKYVPSTGTITEISAVGNGPTAIVVRGTTVYVSLYWDGKIGVFGTDGSAKPSIPLPSERAGADGLAFDKSGTLWVAEEGIGRIARCDATAGKCTDFALASASSAPDSIALGGDGAMWFTESVGNAIGRIDSSGAVHEYAIPTANAHADGIAAAGDGSLWFAERSGMKIGHIATSGTILGEFAPSSGLNAPNNLAIAPDGSVWFTETDGNRISKLTPSGSTVSFTQYASGLTPGGKPAGIAVGMDGRTYFTESATGKIGSYGP
jgi:streptogramin lyase